MFVLPCDGFDVHYAAAAEILSEGMMVNGGGYYLAQTHFSRTDEIAKLLELGFRFHDRRLRLEIGKSRTKDYFEKSDIQTKELQICETASLTEDMLQLAYEVFDTDRRFYLENDFAPAEQAFAVMRAYIAYYQKKPHRVIKAMHGDTILGFVILCETGKDAYENVLGLTRRGLAGMSAATPLYSKALSVIGAAGKRYVGVASSANIASINFNMQLGAKITGVTDQYIMKKTKTGR